MVASRLRSQDLIGSGLEPALLHVRQTLETNNVELRYPLAE